MRSAFLSEDLNGVSTFRIGEVQPGRALPLLRSLGVHEQGGNAPCPLAQPPLASIHGGSSMTKPQQEFTHVRPSGFSLACGTVMAWRSWAFPWASHLAVTSDARQGENRHWTLAWGLLSIHLLSDNIPLNQSDFVSHISNLCGCEQPQPLAGRGGSPQIARS